MMVVGALALIAAATGLNTLLHLAPASVLEDIGRLGWIAAAILGTILVVLAILQRRTASVLITGVLMVTVGWFFARIYLWLFEPIYRSAGTVRLRSGKPGTNPG